MRAEHDAQQAAASGDGKAGTGVAHVAARYRQCGLAALQERGRSGGGRNLRCASGMVSNVLMDRPHSEDDRQCQRQCAFAALCTPQTVCCKRPWSDPGTSSNRPVSGLASDIGPMSSASPSQTLRARRVRRHVGDQWLAVGEDDRDTPELAYRCGGSQGFAEKLRTLFPFNPECHGISGTCCMGSLNFEVNSTNAAHSMPC